VESWTAGPEVDDVKGTNGGEARRVSTIILPAALSITQLHSTPSLQHNTQPTLSNPTTISKMKTSAIFSILALAAAGVASPLADAETLDSKLTPVFNPDV